MAPLTPLMVRKDRMHGATGTYPNGRAELRFPPTTQKVSLLVSRQDRWSFQQVATDLGVIQPKACRNPLAHCEGTQS